MPGMFDDIFGSATATSSPAASAEHWRQTLGLDDLERQHTLPSGLLTSVLRRESGGDPRVKSSAGAQGLFQFMPATAAQYKIDPLDPQQAAPAAAKELSTLYRKYGGDVDRTLAAWNWGQGNVDRKGMANAPAETRGFLTNVKRFLSPGVAEAATPPQAQVTSSPAWDEIFGTAPAPVQAPAVRPAPPTATSTPEQDAAYRASRGQQVPATAPQTSPATTTPPGASQGPGTSRLSLGAPTEAASEAEAATIAAMRASQAGAVGAQPQPADLSALAVGGGPSQQAPTVTDPLALLAVGGGPARPKNYGLRPLAKGDVPAQLPPGVPTAEQETLQEGITAPSTMIPLLMPGAGARAVAPLLARAPAAVGRLVRPLAEGISQTLGYGTGRTAETGEVPSAGELGTTLGVTTVLGGAIEQAAPVVAKVGNAITGTLKPAAQAVVDTAKKYGIRLSTGDVGQGSVAPKFEAALEAIPGSGAGRMRALQQKDVTRAGESIQSGLKSEMQATSWRDLPSVQQAASGTGPRAKEAQALLAEIADAGDDWGRVVQTSGKLNLFQDRVRAEKLYNRVEELAQPLGNMRLPKATQAIDDALARASDDVLPSPEVKREVIGALNRLKGEMSPSAGQPQPSMGVRDPVTGTLRAESVTQATHIPDTTYMRMRGLRSSLGDLQREAAEPATARYLSGVKTALEEDMAAFAAKSNVPQLAKAAKDADIFYRTRIVPYREGQLAKAIEKNLPDEIYNQFVRRGKDRAEYFYKGLDPKGQAAVRYGMVEEAIEKATSGAPDVFSPQRFATSLKKIQDAHGVFFKGTPQWEINGITKLMEHAKRAGQYAENPPTGLRGTIVGSILTGSFFTSPWVAIGALTSSQGLRMLLMTKPGRNLLLAASDMQPGSSALQKRLDTFLRTSPEAAALVGAARSQMPEPAGSR